MMTAVSVQWPLPGQGLFSIIASILPNGGCARSVETRIEMDGWLPCDAMDEPGAGCHLSFAQQLE